MRPRNVTLPKMSWQESHFALTRVPFFVAFTRMGVTGAQPLSIATSSP
jgi:hypothetical protein